MTEDHRENLSAGMDGELSSEALRFLLRRLDHDLTLQQAWSNYHAIGDGMRHELPALASSGFAARVMLAIEQGQGQPMADGKRRHWLRWSAGGAIAASVAVVALMTAQPAGDHAADHAAAVALASAKPASSQPAGLTQVGTPAAVPIWLRDNSDMSGLTERASATLGAPSGEIVAPYASNLSSYQLPRYRTFNNNDGSYLLLIDADAQQQAAQRTTQPARATAH